MVASTWISKSNLWHWWWEETARGRIYGELLTFSHLLWPRSADRFPHSIRIVGGGGGKFKQSLVGSLRKTICNHYYAYFSIIDLHLCTEKPKPRKSYIQSYYRLFQNFFKQSFLFRHFKVNFKKGKVLQSLRGPPDLQKCSGAGIWRNSHQLCKQPRNESRYIQPKVQKLRTKILREGWCSTFKK